MWVVSKENIAVQNQEMWEDSSVIFEKDRLYEAWTRTWDKVAEGDEIGEGKN